MPLTLIERPRPGIKDDTRDKLSLVIIMQLWAASSLLLVLIAASVEVNAQSYRYNKETCLRRLINGASCVARSSKGRPLDRYTCPAVDVLWRCDAHRVADGCPAGLARAHAFNEFQMMRQMFSEGSSCPVFNRHVPAPLGQRSCTNRQLYKTTLAIAICGNLLALIDSTLKTQPCRAMDEFVEKCVNPNLDR